MTNENCYYNNKRLIDIQNKTELDDNPQWSTEEVDYLLELIRTLEYKVERYESDIRLRRHRDYTEYR